jgi:hypothetical protein
VLRRPQPRISALSSRHPRQAPVFSPPFCFSCARPRLRPRRSRPRSVQALASPHLALVCIVTCSALPRARLRIASVHVLGVEPGAPTSRSPSSSPRAAVVPVKIVTAASSASCSPTTRSTPTLIIFCAWPRPERSSTSPTSFPVSRHSSQKIHGLCLRSVLSRASAALCHCVRARQMPLLLPVRVPCLAGRRHASSPSLAGSVKIPGAYVFQLRISSLLVLPFDSNIQVLSINC